MANRKGEARLRSNGLLFFVALAFASATLTGCSNSERESSTGASNKATATKIAATSSSTAPDANRPETKSAEARSVESQVQSEIARSEAQQRAALLSDAQAAIDETRNALAALDKGNKKAALAALERAAGKLDMVVARDPKLALAPVAVTTVIIDLYATPDAVRTAVRQARDELTSNQVQQARERLETLASEADINVAEIPLATYPSAIRAVAPLIDAGKLDDVKAALEAALHTLVIEKHIIPLPRVRAQAMLRTAQELLNKNNRSQDDNQRIRGLIEAVRNEIQLAEALGYGTRDDFKPLYDELDDVQKKVQSGQSKGVFNRLQDRLKNFRFT